jgi:hypothetical protein
MAVNLVRGSSYFTLNFSAQINIFKFSHFCETVEQDFLYPYSKRTDAVTKVTVDYLVLLFTYYHGKKTSFYHRS